MRIASSFTSRPKLAGGGNGDLAAFDGFGEVRDATVEDDTGALHGPFADIEHRCCVGLGHFANWRA